MINLLPEKEKREFKLEMSWRKVVLGLIFILKFLVLLIFILFFLRIYISSRVGALKSDVQESEKELRSSQFQNFKEIIEEANQNLSKIQEFQQNQILLIPFFEKLSALTPETIYFNDLSLLKKTTTQPPPDKGKKIFAQVRITGFAENRESLFFFKKNLEEEENFQEIYFSPSSWVHPADINFSLSFKFTPK